VGGRKNGSQVMVAVKSVSGITFQMRIIGGGRHIIIIDIMVPGTIDFGGKKNNSFTRK